MRRLIPFILLTALFALEIGCAPSSSPITGAERDAVLPFTEPKVDNLLKGFNDGDYAVFSKDMDPQMKAALSETNFPQTREKVIGTIGKYLSRSVSKVEQVGAYMRVTYTAKFEQEDGVSIVVAFDQSSRMVSGLFFTSPKLKGQ